MGEELTSKSLEINKIHQGDCLELMKNIPDNSVDLIITDPPYGTVKNIGNSDKVNHGMKNKTNWDNCLNIKKVFEQCERILRESGTLILFGQEPFTSDTITNSHNNLPFCYRCVWLKDHFANSLISKKAPVNYFEDILVFRKKYDFTLRHPLRDYSKKLFKFIGLQKKVINEKLGHQRADHFFRFDSSQFSLLTENTYNDLIEIFSIDKMLGFLEYSVIRDLYYKNKINPIFNLLGDKKIKSNVFEYKKDYGGLHPTQKPVELIEDLIKTYSNDGNLVLDFTIGSGTTAVACINTNRNFIGIELDEKYCEIARKRVAKAKKE